MTNYLGGKARLGKAIADFLSRIGPAETYYWEPFVGMCGTMRHMQHYRNRLGTDLHGELICMWQAVQKGWTPPERVTEAEYMKIKNHPEDFAPELRGFVAHAVTFNGRYFGSFRDPTGQICERARRNVLKCKPAVQDTHFMQGNYLAMSVPSHVPCLIYCDPPYADVAERRLGATKAFDHEVFWHWVRHMSRMENRTVVVSEVSAPDDFICVWTDPHKPKYGKNKTKPDRLFMLNPSLLSKEK